MREAMRRTDIAQQPSKPAVETVPAPERDLEHEAFLEEVRENIRHFFDRAYNKFMSACQNGRRLDLYHEEGFFRIEEYMEHVLPENIDDATWKQAYAIGELTVKEILTRANALQESGDSRFFGGAYFEYIGHIFFSSPEGLLKISDLRTKLRLFEACTEISVLDSLYNKVFPSLEYHITFDESIDGLNKAVNTGAITERLRAYHAIERISRADNLPSFRGKMQKVLDEVSKRDVSALESMIISGAQINLENDFGECRAIESDMYQRWIEESDHLSCCVKLSGPEGLKTNTVIPIAKDAIATVNAFSIQGIGRVESVETLTPSAPSDIALKERVAALSEKLPYQQVDARDRRDVASSELGMSLARHERAPSMDRAAMYDAAYNAQDYVDAHGSDRQPVSLVSLENYMSDRPEAETWVALVRELHRPIMQHHLEERLGLELKDLYMREQMQLLRFLASADAQLAEDVFSLIRTYGIDAARTFLACEYSSDYGMAILDIADKFDPEVVKAIFRSYSETAKLVYANTEEILAAADIKSGENLEPVRAKVNDQLLDRARNILHIASNALQGKQSIPEAEEQDVLEELQRTKASTAAFCTVFKALFKGKTLDSALENVNGLTYEESVKPRDIADEDKRHMLEIFKENWKDQDPVLAEVFYDLLKKKLESQDGTCVFHVIRKNSEVMAFIRIEDHSTTTKDQVYVGSLNVHPDIRGSGLGDLVMHEIESRVTRHEAVLAQVAPRAEVASAYVEKLKFVITGVDTLHSLSDSSRVSHEFAIRLDSAKYASRSKNPAERSRAQTQKHTFNISKNYQEYIQTIDRLTKTGYVVTGFKLDPSSESIRHLTFEKPMQVSTRSKAPRTSNDVTV